MDTTKLVKNIKLALDTAASMQEELASGEVLLQSLVSEASIPTHIDNESLYHLTAKFIMAISKPEVIMTLIKEYMEDVA